MKKSIQIAPSIATGDLMNLGSEVKRLEQAGADLIHFDVMDGHYVPLLTLGVPIIAQMKKATKLPLDVHIMVTNPDAVFETYLDAGADALTFHIETALHAHRICAKIRERGVRAGISLSPATHWHEVEFLLPYVDQVTVMAVNPGYSRQAHIASMKQKVEELATHRKNQKLAFDIEVDGGVSKDNIGSLVSAGATILVAGGAIFNNSDYAAAIAELRGSI